MSKKNEKEDHPQLKEYLILDKNLPDASPEIWYRVAFKASEIPKVEKKFIIRNASPSLGIILDQKKSDQ